METKLSQQLGIIGRVRYKKSIKGKVIFVSDWIENLIMNGTDTGKNLVADRLAGTNTYSMNIKYADIGTGTTPATIADTKLQTSTARVATTSAIVTANVVAFQFFFPSASLANGTYTEFATFVDGTATKDTGQIFNRVIISISKGTNEDITIEYDVTIT